MHAICQYPYSTVYNSQDMEITYMAIDKGMDKEVVHVYNEVLLSL